MRSVGNAVVAAAAARRTELVLSWCASRYLCDGSCRSRGVGDAATAACTARCVELPSRLASCRCCDSYRRSHSVGNAIAAVAARRTDLPSWRASRCCCDGCCCSCVVGNAAAATAARCAKLPSWCASRCCCIAAMAAAARTALAMPPPEVLKQHSSWLTCKAKIVPAAKRSAESATCVLSAAPAA